MLRVLVLAVMLRRGFQPSRLGTALVAMISLASGVWIILFDDLAYNNLSRHCWIYPMRQMCEVLGMLVKEKDMIEKQTGRKIKELQIGNVERYKNQFLRFDQNTDIDTHFMMES